MKIAELARRLFSMKTLAWYTERVCTLGIAVPLAHFVVLPFSIFAYVVSNIFSGKHVVKDMSDSVTFTVGIADFRGFFWLMAFWTYATVAAFIVFGIYRIIVRSYRDRPFPRIFAKGMLSVFLTSGSVERLIANNFVNLPVEYAPKFQYSLYRDLGALVRSPAWDLGRYSFVSAYTWIPLTAVCTMFLVYLWKRIVIEVRYATRER